MAKFAMALPLMLVAPLMGCAPKATSTTLTPLALPSPTSGLAAPPSSVPTAAKTVAYSNGCIGRSLDECLANLRTGFSFSPLDNVADAVKKNEEVDVNGKRIRKARNLFISGNYQFAPGISNMMSVDLSYSESNTVDYIGISLIGDPSSANTEAEYDKTGLYAAVSLLLGAQCPDLDKLSLYKFFQNTVKPKIISEPKKTEISPTGAETTYFRKALDIPYCGRRLSYTNLFGYDTERIGLDNPHGAFFRTSVSFK